MLPLESTVRMESSRSDKSGTGRTGLGRWNRRGNQWNQQMDAGSSGVVVQGVVYLASLRANLASLRANLASLRASDPEANLNQIDLLMFLGPQDG